MTNLFLPLYFQSPDESGITLLQSFEHYCRSPLPYTVAEINILGWYGKYLKILSLNGDQQIYEIIFYFRKTDNCSLWWDASAHQCIRKKKQHLAASLICACLTSFFARAVRISQLCRKRETETEVCHQWPHCQKQISATALYKIFTELQCTWLLGWWPQSRSRYSQHLLKYDLKFSFIHKYKIITYDTQIVQAGQAEATECGESLYKGKKMPCFNMAF